MDGLTPLTLNFSILVGTATLLLIAAKKLKQPPLVAYLLTGILIGPIALDVVTETASIEFFSKLGLSFLLFLVGTRMNFKELKNLFRPLLKISVGQILAHGVLSASVAYLLGFGKVEVIIITLATIYSSTAVIVKHLSDRNEASTTYGKIDTGVLIAQDIFVVMALGILNSPSLTNLGVLAVKSAEVIFLVSMIALVAYASSKKVLPRLFKSIARKRHILFISGVAWAFAFISASIYFNISIEIGAFLAGLALGQIPYRRELGENIKPLTDFFMVIFFSSIGLSLTRESLLFYWQEAVITSISFIVGGILIMFFLIHREGFSLETAFRGSINMSQTSEFSLVLGALAVSRGFIHENILGYLALIAIITMSVSAYFIYYGGFIFDNLRPYLLRFEPEEERELRERLEDHALIVGYNQMAESVLHTLQDHFNQVAVVDKDPEKVNALGGEDLEYVFGDFRHSNIQRAVSLREANLIISFAEKEEVNESILDECKGDCLVFIETKSSELAADYYGLGADYIIRENELTAEKIKDYLELFIENPPEFIEEIEKDRESLLWGGKGD